MISKNTLLVATILLAIAVTCYSSPFYGGGKHAGRPGGKHHGRSGSRSRFGSSSRRRPGRSSSVRVSGSVSGSARGGKNSSGINRGRAVLSSSKKTFGNANKRGRTSGSRRAVVAGRPGSSSGRAVGGVRGGAGGGKASSGVNRGQAKLRSSEKTRGNANKNGRTSGSRHAVVAGRPGSDSGRASGSVFGRGNGGKSSSGVNHGKAILSESEKTRGSASRKGRTSGSGHRRIAGRPGSVSAGSISGSNQKPNNPIKY